MSSLKFEDLASLDIERVSLEVAGKRVFWRADLDVPRSGDAITDTTRLKRAGRGIRSLAERGACVVVAGHSGRPKGERSERAEAWVARTDCEGFKRGDGLSGKLSA